MPTIQTPKMSNHNIELKIANINWYGNNTRSVNTHRISRGNILMVRI